MATGTFATIMDETITSSKACKPFDATGFRRMSLLGRFEGPADSTFKIEINNEGLLVAQEFLKVNESGWLNVHKEYTVFGPHIGVVVYHPATAGLKVKLMAYTGV